MRGWKYGFASPFKAEVVFVSTRQFTSNKWGTKQPVMTRDPELGPVRLRVFGTFAMRVGDAESFVRELVGANSSFTIGQITDQIRDLVVARFTELLGENSVPVLQLAAIRVLKARGAPTPTIDIWDPYRINELDRDALHAALATGTGTHRGNLALWVVDHPDESSREPLIAFARSLVADAARNKQPFPSEGPRHYELYWTVYALIQLGGAEKLFEELLLAEDREVCDAVLRYCERIGPQIARGMVHVLSLDKHWRQAAARDWLKKRKSDPRIAAALAELGLTIEDVTRTPKDEA